MQQDMQNKVDESMGVKLANSVNPSVEGSYLMKTVTGKLSSSVSSLGGDFERWSRVFFEKYDVAAGVSLAFGRRALMFARRHPFYTAAGVLALGFVLGKTLKTSSSSVSGRTSGKLRK